jgi:hypothetical protein
MLQKANADHRQHGALPSRQIGCHPICKTAGLDFVPHRAKASPPGSIDLPSHGQLILWQFRADWHLISRDEARTWLSVDERSRAKHYPNSALAKRYLVGRAMLRRILSGMLACEPQAIALSNGSDEQPQIFRAEPHRNVRLHVTYAGVWIMIGLSSTDVGIGAVMPVPSTSSTESPPVIQSLRETATTLPLQLFPEVYGAPQQRWARHASLARLASIGVLGPEPAILTEYGAATVVHTANDQRCHVLDLPMPGEIAAAVAVPQLVTRIDAFGWASD